MRANKDGREAFDNGAWSQAYLLLNAADKRSLLEPEDLDRLATAAYLIGEDAASGEAQARAHARFLERGDRVRAAASALKLAFAIIDNPAQRAEAAGVQRVPRVTGVRNGLPILEDDRVLDVRNVIWCTGYHAGFSWIDLPVFGPDGDPRHEAGIVASEPGLYFVGLHFLYAFSSEMIHGVGRDAARIAASIAAGRSSQPDRLERRTAA